MVNLYAEAVVVCDEHDNGRECTATAQFREKLTRYTGDEFAERAKQHFLKLGWLVGVIGYWYCPNHNQKVKS